MRETSFEHVATEEAAKQLYQDARQAMQVEAWNEALSILEFLNIEHPSSPYAEKAELSIVECYIHKKELRKASTALNAFIFDHPQSKHRGAAERLKSDIEKQRAIGPWGYAWRVVVVIIALKFVIGILTVCAAMLALLI